MGHSIRGGTLLSGVVSVLVATSLGACNSFVELGASLGEVPTERKIVVEKSPPDILRAEDGTECVVPSARFDSVDLGDDVSCVWADELEGELDAGVQ